MINFLKILILVALILLYSCNSKKKNAKKDDSYLSQPSINSEELVENLKEYLNSNISDSLNLFFNKWERDIKPYSIDIKLNNKVRINSYEIFNEFFTDIDNQSKYYLIQNKIRYKVKAARKVGLEDCNIKSMDSLLYFRPKLIMNDSLRPLYLCDEYEVIINDVLAKVNSLKSQDKYQKMELLGQFIPFCMSEFDDNYGIHKSFYISYIVFNRDYNRAILKCWPHEYNSETWQLIKKNGKWRKEKLLEQLMI